MAAKVTLSQRLYLENLVTMYLDGKFSQEEILEMGYSQKQFDHAYKRVTNEMREKELEERKRTEIKLNVFEAVDDSAKHDLKNYNVKLSSLSGKFIQDLKKYGFVK